MAIAAAFAPEPRDALRSPNEGEFDMNTNNQDKNTGGGKSGGGQGGSG